MTERKHDCCITCDQIVECRKGRCIDCWQGFAARHSQENAKLKRRALVAERSVQTYQDELLNLHQLLAAKEAALEALTGAPKLDRVAGGGS